MFASYTEPPDWLLGGLPTGPTHQLPPNTCVEVEAPDQSHMCVTPPGPPHHAGAWAIAHYSRPPVFLSDVKFNLAFPKLRSLPGGQGQDVVSDCVPPAASIGVDKRCRLFLPQSSRFPLIKEFVPHVDGRTQLKLKCVAVLPEISSSDIFDVIKAPDGPCGFDMS